MTNTIASPDQGGSEQPQPQEEVGGNQVVKPSDVLGYVLDKFNEAVANMSLQVSGADEWEKRYDSIKEQTIWAIQDSSHLIHHRVSDLQPSDVKAKNSPANAPKGASPDGFPSGDNPGFKGDDEPVLDPRVPDGFESELDDIIEEGIVAVKHMHTGDTYQLKDSARRELLDAHANSLKGAELGALASAENAKSPLESKPISAVSEERNRKGERNE